MRAGTSVCVVGCLVLLWCLAAASAAAGSLVVDLAHASWTRNGEPVEESELVGPEDDPAVRLVCDGLGVRWGARFATDEPTSWWLALEWEPGPEGLVIEIMIDGESLPPLRDAWRPAPRRLTVDLGPRWLGQGEHLIEFVAREARGDGALVLRRLLLEVP